MQEIFVRGEMFHYNYSELQNLTKRLWPKKTRNKKYYKKQSNFIFCIFKNAHMFYKLPYRPATDIFYGEVYTIHEILNAIKFYWQTE